MFSNWHRSQTRNLLASGRQKYTATASTPGAIIPFGFALEPGSDYTLDLVIDDISATTQTIQLQWALNGTSLTGNRIETAMQLRTITSPGTSPIYGLTLKVPGDPVGTANHLDAEIKMHLGDRYLASHTWSTYSVGPSSTFMNSVLSSARMLASSTSDRFTGFALYLGPTPPAFTLSWRLYTNDLCR